MKKRNNVVPFRRRTSNTRPPSAPAQRYRQGEPASDCNGRTEQVVQFGGLDGKPYVFYAASTEAVVRVMGNLIRLVELGVFESAEQVLDDPLARGVVQTLIDQAESGEVTHG